MISVTQRWILKLNVKLKSVKEQLLTLLNFVFVNRLAQPSSCCSGLTRNRNYDDG